MIRYLCILMALLSCNVQAPLTPTDKTAISDDCISTIHRYYESVAKNGLTAELEYLDNSEDFFWIPPGYDSAISYDSVSNFIKLNASKFTSVRNQLEEIKIIPLTKEISEYTCVLTSEMTDTTGKKNNYRLRECGTLIKRNSGWKLLCGQTVLLEN